MSQEQGELKSFCAFTTRDMRSYRHGERLTQGNLSCVLWAVSLCPFSVRKSAMSLLYQTKRTTPLGGLTQRRFISHPCYVPSSGQQDGPLFWGSLKDSGRWRLPPGPFSCGHSGDTCGPWSCHLKVTCGSSAQFRDAANLRITADVLLFILLTWFF